MPPAWEDERTQILRFYKQHNPEKATDAQVDALLHAYTFPKICSSLHREYGAAPPGWSLVRREVEGRFVLPSKYPVPGVCHFLWDNASAWKVLSYTLSAAPPRASMAGAS